MNTLFKNTFYTVLIFFAFTFFSCKKDAQSTPAFTGYSYAANTVGHEIIYDVDSISKSDFTGTTDTFHFQIKEVIESSFIDNAGNPSLRLERYKRLNQSQPWTIYKVWSASFQNTEFDKKEDNITFTKLVFPVLINKKWNGNARNELDEMEYEYTSVNSKENFNTFSFDSSLTVQQNNFDDKILNKDFEIEKFATGVGMFFKESFIGTYKVPMPPQPLTIQDSLEKYTYYTEKMISYKN